MQYYTPSPFTCKPLNYNFAPLEKFFMVVEICQLYIPRFRPGFPDKIFNHSLIYLRCNLRMGEMEVLSEKTLLSIMKIYKKLFLVLSVKYPDFSSLSRYPLKKISFPYFSSFSRLWTTIFLKVYLKMSISS